MDGNMDWLARYISAGFFTDLKFEAWRYYLLNVTSYGFLWFNSITFGNLEFVREVCPDAALLVLLLRAEERLPLRESEAPLLQYAQMLGGGSSTGMPAAGAFTPSVADVQPPATARDAGEWRWPLAAGLERLRVMAERLAAPEEISVDVVMPYCAESLEGLLSRSTGYADNWLPSGVPFGHANLHLYRLASCGPPPGSAGELTGDSALASLPPSAAGAARQFASVRVVSVDAKPSAWEAARYFQHLSDRYERLADFTMFLHPDVFEHVNPRTLRNVMQVLRVGTFRQVGQEGEPWYDHVSLSHHYIDQPQRARSPSSNCTDVQLGFEDVRKLVLGPDSGSAAAGEGATGGEQICADRQACSDATKPTGADGAGAGAAAQFGFYCCSQFLVHRDAVMRRPRQWYERVARGVAWEHCATSYMEALWHAVFNGGILHEAKRQDRGELPLFLRVDNFIEDTSKGLT